MPGYVPPSSFIYNGLETPPFPPKPLPVDVPRLLCLGRLVPDKGFDLALAALASIAEGFPHVRLVIAGDGPERPALEQQTAELGLSNVVEFAGWIAPDAVPALMNTSWFVRHSLPTPQSASVVGFVHGTW